MSRVSLNIYLGYKKKIRYVFRLYSPIYEYGHTNIYFTEYCHTTIVKKSEYVFGKSPNIFPEGVFQIEYMFGLFPNTYSDFSTICVRHCDMFECTAHGLDHIMRILSKSQYCQRFNIIKKSILSKSPNLYSNCQKVQIYIPTFSRLQIYLRIWYFYIIIITYDLHQVLCTPTHWCTHCNTLMYTLQHTNVHTATHCNTLMYTLQHTNVHTATHCNTLMYTLQHTATH